ncbi:MAG: glycosyltransferase [Sphingomonadales bacterium]|nr:glycosyltransferase [Sphingomonadales bacterium]
MIAYHFPPVRVSSGIQRTLKFCTYLREHEWEPLVLTISPKAYEVTSPDQLKEIPDDVIVERAFGLDTSRHLAFRGKYLRWMAQPDNWISWWPGAIWTGMRMIKKYQPDAIFSTFPIATAHLIGLSLCKRSGLPWVADFRDAMTEEDYPRDPLTWKVQRRLEAATVQQCTRALFTTNPTRDMYAGRYPDISESKWAVVENGYDEDNFINAEAGPALTPLGKPGQLTLVHSGVLYPIERDPRAFFAALSQLKLAGVINADTLQVVLRATGSDDLYRPQLAALNIEDIVRLEPVIAYRDALREMLRADGLLLFQGSVCNHQIPAKIYEYYRSGKPIFSLVDANGISARMLYDVNARDQANITDAQSIADSMQIFLDKLRNGLGKGVERALAIRHSRRSRTGELAAILDQLTK